MKLAEALAERADLQQRYEQVRSRAQAAARYQEGEEPPEDAQALLAQADEMLERLHAGAADAAAGQGQDGPHGYLMMRQMRSELRYVSAVDVPALRRTVDDIAKEFRELDVRIQQANWEVDLAD